VSRNRSTAKKLNVNLGFNQRKKPTEVQKTKAISSGHSMQLRVDGPFSLKLGLVIPILFDMLSAPWSLVVWPSVAVVACRCGQVSWPKCVAK
jgi:hypothetical protein